MSLTTCPELPSQKTPRGAMARKTRTKPHGFVSTDPLLLERSVTGFNTVRDIYEWNLGIGTDKVQGCKHLMMTNQITSVADFGSGIIPKTDTPRGRRHNPPYTKENEERRRRAEQREIQCAASRRARYASRERDYNPVTHSAKGCHQDQISSQLPRRTSLRPAASNPITGSDSWY